MMSKNILNKEIDNAMLELRTLDLSDESLGRISSLAIALTDIERISDHAENIVEYAQQMHSKKSTLSDDAREELRKMSNDALSIVHQALEIFENEEYENLPAFNALEESIDQQKTMLVDHHVERLMNRSCDPFAGIIFTNMASDLERTGDHAVNIAYALTDIDPDENDRVL